MIKIAKIALLCAAFTIFVVSCTQSDTTVSNTANNSSANDTAANDTAANETVVNEAPAEPLTAKGIYKESCAKCHKDDGTGGAVDIDGKTLKAKNLTSEGAKKDSDEEFIDYITDGIPDEGMPAFKDKLSSDEIKAVVKYIREELQKS